MTNTKLKGRVNYRKHVETKLQAYSLIQPWLENLFQTSTSFSSIFSRNWEKMGNL